MIKTSGKEGQHPGHKHHQEKFYLIKTKGKKYINNGHMDKIVAFDYKEKGIEPVHKDDENDKDKEV